METYTGNKKNKKNKIDYLKEDAIVPVLKHIDMVEVPHVAVFTR